MRAGVVGGLLGRVEVGKPYGLTQMVCPESDGRFVRVLAGHPAWVLRWRRFKEIVGGWPRVSPAMGMGPSLLAVVVREGQAVANLVVWLRRLHRLGYLSGATVVEALVLDVLIIPSGVGSVPLGSSIWLSLDFQVCRVALALH